MKATALPFSRIALMALALGVLVNLFQAITAIDFPILIVANVACLVALSAIAVMHHQQRRSGFDAVVAAETIVAFGVMSLILSLAAAVYPLLSAKNFDVLFQGDGLRRIATPFLEGLATAGLAPLFAMILRNRVSELEGAADPIGDATGLSRAMANLTRQIEAAQAASEGLATSLATAARSTTSVADTMGSEGERLKYVLLEAQSGFKGLGGAAADSKASITQLANETERLKVSVGDTKTLLDALATLIEAVERFVAPGSSRKGS